MSTVGFKEGWSAVGFDHQGRRGEEREIWEEGEERHQEGKSPSGLGKKWAGLSRVQTDMSSEGQRLRTLEEWRSFGTAGRNPTFK